MHLVATLAHDVQDYDVQAGVDVQFHVFQALWLHSLSLAAGELRAHAFVLGAFCRTHFGCCW